MADPLRLYYPVRPFRVNQAWGDNLPCVQNFGESNQVIVTGKDNVTCPVGFEKLYPNFGMSGHNGMDLAAGIQPVYAACSGTVIEKQTVPARGLGLGILADTKTDFGVCGERYAKLRYWHLKSFAKEVGDHVDVGDIIGISDSTGYSSGNHLHFELNLMDKDAGGHPSPYYHGSMIAGSIDAAPYFTGVYADEFSKAITLNQKLVTVLQKLVELLIRK